MYFGNNRAPHNMANGSRGGSRGFGGPRRNTSTPVAHVNGAKIGDASHSVGKAVGRAMGRNTAGFLGGLIGGAIGGAVADAAGVFVTNAINNKIDENQAMEEAEREAKMNAAYDAAYDTVYNEKYVDPNARDEFGLTKEERANYPKECPHCMGVPDGSRICPYCGGNVI